VLGAGAADAGGTAGSELTGDVGTDATAVVGAGVGGGVAAGTAIVGGAAVVVTTRAVGSCPSWPASPLRTSTTTRRLTPVAARTAVDEAATQCSRMNRQRAHGGRWRDQQPSGDAPVALRHGVDEGGAHRAVLDVLSGAELGLAATIAGRKSEERRSALAGGQPHTAEHEQVLEAQIRPGTSEPHGDRAAADTGLVGQGAEIGAADLVANQQVAFAGIDTSHRRSERNALLVVERAPLGIDVVVAVIGQSVGVAVVHGPPAEVRGEEIASGHHRVRPLLVERQRMRTLRHAQQRLLRDVVDEVRIADPR
jgi:hypothetical protein